MYRLFVLTNGRGFRRIGVGYLLVLATVIQGWSAGFTTNWTTTVSSPQTGSIAVSTNGTIFYPSQYSVLALNTASTQQWVGYFGKQVFHSTVAVLPDGGIAAAGGDQVIAFDPDGSERWHKTIGLQGFDHAMAVGSDGTLYLGNRDGKIYALDTDGNQKWAFTTGDQLFGGPPQVRAGPVIGKDGTIYCGASDGRLYAINPDGSERWNYMVGSPVSMVPSIGDDGTIYVAGYNGVLVAVSPGGAKKWQFSGFVNGEPSWPPAIGPDGTIYYVCYTYIYSLKPNGTTNWQYKDSFVWRTPVLLSDGSLYVIGGGQLVVHLNHDGTVRRQHNALGSILYPPAVTEDGTVFFAADTKVFSLGGGLGPAESPWPMFQKDLQRTGRVPALPEVDWVMPAEGMTFVSGQSVPLRVDPVNLPSVDQVDFFADGDLLGSDASPPFQWDWSAVGPASVTFTAVGIAGATSVTSAPVTVEVIASQANQYPTVTITSPTNHTTWLAGQNVSLTSAASDPDGIVVDVEFYDNDALAGTSSFPGFIQTVTNISAGLHEFRSVAIDNDGARSTSAVVNAYALLKNWRVPSPSLSQNFHAPATGTNGIIYVGAGESLYALNPAGQTNWAYFLNTMGTVSTAAAVGDDGTIYFGDSSGYLHAVAPNGAGLWKFPGSGYIYAAPSIGSNDVIYFSNGNGLFYALDSAGLKLWQTNIAGAAAAIGGDGTIYIAAGDGIHALHGDGSEEWNYPVAGGATATPALGADGTLYFGAANVGKFYALSSSGIKQWSIPISSGVSGAAAAVDVDGNVVFGTTDGHLYSLSSAGETNWTIAFGSTISATPLLARDGTLYVPCGNGRLYAVNGAGSIVWEFQVASGSFNSCGISTNGDILFPGGDGYLYSLDQSALLSSGPWPMEQQNPRHNARGWTVPIVELTNPPPESVFVEGDNVRLETDVSLSGKPIVQVEYLSDSNVVTTVSVSPFMFDWNPPGGVHYLQARATDSQGAVGTSAAKRIKVVPPGTEPALLVSPISITTVTNGGSVLLSLDVFGSAPLTFTWYKDGAVLTGETGPQLLLTSVTIADAAKYSVVVSNSFGHAQSEPSVVNVLQPVVARWASSSGTPIYTGPVLAKGGIVQYGNGPGDLFAYDQRGNFEWWWKADLVTNGVALVDDEIQSTPAISADGVTHLVTRSGLYYRINPDGTEHARTQQFGSDSSPSFGTNGTVYLGSGNKLRAYSPNGNFLWDAGVTGPLNSGPAIGSDGTIYVTSDGLPVFSNLYSGSLTAFMPSGDFKWTFVTGDFVGASPAIGTNGTIYFGSRDEKLYAVSPNGGKLWEFPTDGPIYGSAVVAADGTIFFGNDGAFIPEIGIRKGHFYALNANGQLKWSFQADGEVRSTPVLAEDGTIYFGANDWYVYALNPNGTLRWKYRTLGRVQTPLSMGFDGTVYATSVDGRLYALFENPSPLANAPWPKFKHDVRNTGNVATTNDAPEWVFPFDSNAFDNGVTAIAVQGNEIYVGGDFSIAGGRRANHVAKWDGSQWLPLGDGVDGSVSSMAWYNGELYVGGYFNHAGGQDIRFLARWNGTAWSAVGPPLNEYVRALAVHQGLLYVGGNFNYINGVSVGSLLSWNGTDFNDTGLGSPSRTTALASLDGDLYAGVTKLGPPGDDSYGVVRWTGSGWEEVGRGLNGEIWTLAIYNNQLHVGGQFTAANAVPMSGIARWTGAAWEALPEVLGFYLAPTVSALLVYNGELYAGGFFTEAGELHANGLAHWDGVSWESLGGGLTKGGLSHFPGAAALAAQGDSLLIGGYFRAADGNPDIRYFTRWQNGTYEALGEKLSFVDGLFHFTLFPDLGITYGVEVSSNLVDWTRLVTFTNSNTAIEFIDTNSVGQAQRYYRAVFP